MAKQVRSIKIELECDPVGGTHNLRCAFYQVGDDSNSEIIYKSPGRLPRRAIETAELSGTLQEFMTTIKSDIEAQEGI